MSSVVSSFDVVQYRDRKRYLWLLSIFVPALMNAGLLLYLLSRNVLMLWVPVAFNYLVMPLADFLVGEDRSNPPESAIEALEEDRYYRYITYAVVPVLWITYIFAAWFVVRYSLPWYGLLAVILTTGSAGGFCINVGHELGHKQTTLERWLAKIILAPTGYGHFTIEHNRGHHLDVATPGDPASARMGEGLWRFALREMPGAVARSWRLERERLSSLPQTGLESAQRNSAAPVDHAVVLRSHDRVAGNSRASLPRACRRCGPTSNSRAPITSNITDFCAARWPTAVTSAASRTTPGTATTCSPTGRCFICSGTPTTTLIPDAAISRCAISSNCQRCPTDISGCSPWRTFRRSGSA